MMTEHTSGSRGVSAREDAHTSGAGTGLVGAAPGGARPIARRPAPCVPDTHPSRRPARAFLTLALALATTVSTVPAQALAAAVSSAADSPDSPAAASAVAASAPEAATGSAAEAPSADPSSSLPTLGADASAPSGPGSGTASEGGTPAAQSPDPARAHAEQSSDQGSSDPASTPSAQSDDATRAVPSDLPIQWATSVTSVSATAYKDNIVFSVPTDVPLTVKADGTLVGPDPDKTAIENKCAYPIHVTNAEAKVTGPFTPVADVDAAKDTANVFQLKIGSADNPVDVAAAVASDNGCGLSDDASYNISYGGGAKGSLPIHVTGKMARVTLDMTEQRALCSVSWTLHAGAADHVAEPGDVYDGLSLRGLKQAADDIAQNGEKSAYYARLHDDMLAGKTGSIKLTDDEVFTFRIIGLAQDEKSEAQGKAGITFQATHALDKAYRMNPTNVNAGGWEKSELRKSMNEGEIWSLFPDDFKALLAPVDKSSNNRGGDDKWIVDDPATGAGHGSGTSKDAPVTKTSDRLWLPSFHELTGSGWGGYGWSFKEGGQYEYYAKLPVNPWDANPALVDLTKTADGVPPKGAYIYTYTAASGSAAGQTFSGALSWERSVDPGSPNAFRCVGPSGRPHYRWDASSLLAVAPAFSF